MIKFKYINYKCHLPKQNPMVEDMAIWFECIYYFRNNFLYPTICLFESIIGDFESSLNNFCLKMDKSNVRQSYLRQSYVLNGGMNGPNRSFISTANINDPYGDDLRRQKLNLMIGQGSKICQTTRKQIWATIFNSLLCFKLLKQSDSQMKSKC